MKAASTSISRRAFCGALAIGSLTTRSSLAQSKWKPNRPVNIVVPYPPGGGSDVVARILSAAIKDHIAQPVVVDNKPGASGSLGVSAVYGARNDGHVILLGTLDTQVLVPNINKVSFDSLKMPAIIGLARTPFVLMGRPDLPVREMNALTRFAIEKEVIYASAGNGTSLHVTMALLADRLQIRKPLHVPYQGVAPAIQALLASQVDLMFVPLVNAIQHRDRLPALAVSSTDRSSSLPYVPSFRELGINVVVDSWFGFFAPPGTESQVLDQLHDTVQSVLSTPHIRERFHELGLTIDRNSRQEFGKFVGTEYSRWMDVVRENGLAQY